MNKPKPVININEVNVIIELIKKLDFENLAIEEIQIHFNKLINGFSVSAYIFNPGLLLFRGITYSQRPNFYTDIIYPPLDKSKINRASNDGEQMFYAATSKRAVFYELNVMPGDKLVVSSWITNNELLFNNIGYTKANFEALSAKRLPLIDPIGDENNRFIADFIAEYFCRHISETDNYLYKATIAIARIHLMNVFGKKFSGLFYPTVRLNAEEENFAILKDSIDRNLLDFESILFIEITDKLENGYKYKIIDVADSMKNGIINWKNLKKTWTLHDNSTDLYFTEENGHINAYDQDGESIDPD